MLVLNTFADLSCRGSHMQKSKIKTEGYINGGAPWTRPGHFTSPFQAASHGKQNKKNKKRFRSLYVV